MYLWIENYSERGSISWRTTTVIINRPLKLDFKGFFHFNQNAPRALPAPLFKSVTQRVWSKIAEVSYKVTQTLATVVNWLGKNRVTYLNSILDVLMWGMVANGWCMLRSGFRRAFLSARTWTAMRESAVDCRTDPALKYALCYKLFFQFSNIFPIA